MSLDQQIPESRAVVLGPDDTSHFDAKAAKREAFNWLLTIGLYVALGLGIYSLDPTGFENILSAAVNPLRGDPSPLALLWYWCIAGPIFLAFGYATARACFLSYSRLYSQKPWVDFFLWSLTPSGIRALRTWRWICRVSFFSFFVAAVVPFVFLVFTSQ